MAFNLFKKTEPKAKPTKKEKPAIQVEEKDETVTPTIRVGGSSVLKNFYVSEKASRLVNVNQYMFAVTTIANKNEIKKQVEKMFNVKVTKIRILNMPEKKRTVGRHAGIKSGFKKAIITLAEGNSISQAQ